MCLCHALHAAKPALDRAALAGVKRIAVVTPFFCTQTLLREPKNEAQETYCDTLRMLETTIQERLPVSLAELGRFRVAPPALTARALRALGWNVQDLYEEEASLYGPWPRLDAARAAKLAKKLKVDAVLVAAMREPASTREGYQIRRNQFDLNPLNFSFQRYPNHVVSPRVQAFLVQSNGKIIWRDEQMAEHPRTKPSTMKTLCVDWQEATLHVAQKLTDNLIREAGEWKVEKKQTLGRR